MRGLRRDVPDPAHQEESIAFATRGNARVCREGPVFALGEVRFSEGEPATVGLSA